MVAKIIDGKRLADEIIENIRTEIIKLPEKLSLAVLLVGENPASKIYINMKEIVCQKIGITLKKFNLQKEVDEKSLLDLIEKLNKDRSVNGILVQLPLPEHLNELKVFEKIDPKKDVDGLTSHNMGNLILGKEELASCTAKGIIKLLDKYQITIKGKEIIIINHSNLIGKPLSMMLLNRNATVTICHYFTKELEKHTKRAEILITGIGKSKMITDQMIKEGIIIIDAGISKDEKTISGDVDFESVKNKASYISPVPGGVGPMTIAMLMENVFHAYQLQKREEITHRTLINNI